MGYNVKKTFIFCAAAFSACALTVSVTLYALTFAPFGSPAYNTVNENAETETPRPIAAAISQLNCADGIGFDATFTPGTDNPAAVVKNYIKAFPPLSQTLQTARYNGFMSVIDGDAVDFGDFAYYCQAWEEYASIPYGNETIGSYGCGPTNVAMVVSTLTGKRVTPDKVASLSEQWGFFVPGTGTSHGIFDKSAGYYNLTVETFNASRGSIISKLKAGQLIICSMVSGYFSRSGHFITLRGITADGKILIADSISQENTGKAWDLDFLISQLRYSQMWAFGA